LVQPLNNEHDLQRINEIQLDKLRSEFRSGLDALTRIVFERTRPKQVGATMMMGPVVLSWCLPYPLHGRFVYSLNSLIGWYFATGFK
ncbi:unnamed protein product, partial [Prunus brigantina]